MQKGKFSEQWEEPRKRDLPTDKCTKQKGRATDLECYVFEKVLPVMNKGELYSFSLICFCPFLAFSNKVFNETTTMDLSIENPKPMYS